MATATPRRTSRRPHLARRGALLALLGTALTWPAPAPAADCGYLYDDAFLASMKRTFGQAPPKRSGHVSTMAECQFHLQRALAEHRNDTLLQRTICVCDGDDGGPARPSASSGRPAPSGGSLQQQLAATVVSSLLDALFAFLDAPAGPDGDAVRKQVQVQWEAEERERLAAVKRRDEEAFRRSQQVAAALLGSRPAGAGGGAAAPAALAPLGGDAVHLGTGRVPALLRGAGAVSEAEWAEARAWQERVDLLRAKGALTPAEARELAALEGKRNARWSRAVAVPGLTQRDRDGLRLKLAVADEGAVAASTDDLLEAREQAARTPAALPVAAASTLVEASTTAGLQLFVEAVGQEGADLAGHRLTAAGKKIVQLGDACFAVSAGWAVVQGTYQETAGPAVSWVLGKVVDAAPTLGPAVGMAQAGGAITAATARFSLQRFIEETDKVVPGVLAPGQTGEEKYEELKGELTLPQRFVAEGVGM